jgi:two-component system, chemotaxis family, protein-glutamate methylesterase/glutaminase
VQHMPAGFTGPFAARLNSICKVRVKEAEQGEILEGGTVLIAPATWHLTLQRRTPAKCCVSLAKEPADTLHRPSVDVMMLSVAEAFRSQAVGVILTGMGADGAQGMKAIFQAGGHTIGQDAASCAVYGMPRACAEMGILKRVAPLTRVSAEILAALPPSRSLVLASTT